MINDESGRHDEGFDEYVRKPVTPEQTFAGSHRCRLLRAYPSLLN